MASFPSLLVWLDGQDFSSIRKDASGFVDLWEDKSGKDNDFEDYTVDGRPTAHPSGGVTFANGKWLVTQPWTGSTPEELAGNPAFTVILAAKGDSSGKRMVVIANPGPNRIHMEEDGAITVQDNNGVWNNQSASYNFSTPSVGAWRRAQGAGYDESDFFLNGDLKSVTFSGNPDSSNLVVNPSNSYLALGHNSIGFAGEIYEVFIFAERLGDKNIQMIEGYLAHKWDTASLLPDGHAFKNHSPTLTPTLKTATTFDYESNASSYSIRVQAKDEYNATVEKVFTVSLLDVFENQNPQIHTEANGTILENELFVLDLNASDPDGDALSYSILYGDDSEFFELNASNGSLRFLNPPDFENPDDNNSDNIYELTVGVSDGHVTEYLNLNVWVLDAFENQNPQIHTEANGTILENELFVLDLNASDPDGDALSYSILYGDDSEFFELNASNGSLRFLNPPILRTPTTTTATTPMN